MDPYRIHKTYLGVDPEEVHARLYTGFPKARGFSLKAASEEHFKAVFMTALAQTFDGQGFQECLILTPAAQTPWVNEQMVQITRQMFVRWKGFGDLQVRTAVVERMAQSIKHLLAGSRVLQLDGEPPRWVAYGFTEHDPVPQWLKGGLLPGVETVDGT